MATASVAAGDNTAVARLARRGIIVLSTIDWDFLWQRQQELASRFAQAGVPLLYVEPLGVRSANLGDLRKLARRVGRRLGQGGRPSTTVSPGLSRLSPLAVPLQGSRLVDALNGRLVARSIGRAAQSMTMQAPVLWTYYATRAVLRLADALRPGCIVYDCIDDVARNARGVAPDYALSERALLRRADLVLTTSSLLYADKRPFNERTFLIPPGANTAHFAAGLPEPVELGGLPHPRLCFFGGIDERLDLDMLADIARRRPAWSIVLIGVVRTDVSPLAGLRNVVFTGQKPYELLPAYLQHMDALLLPYLINEYTRRIYPAKVFECMATGKPVLATRLPDLEALDGYIRLVSAGDVLAAVEQVLAGEQPQIAQRRRTLAQANSWDARFQDIVTLLSSSLPADVE